MTEAAAAANATGAIDYVATKAELSSSSTNRRIAQLKLLDDKINQKCEPRPLVVVCSHGGKSTRADHSLSTIAAAVDHAFIPKLLKLLFDTHPLYDDRASRRAAQACLASIFATTEDTKVLAPFITALRNESQKPSIATRNAFVLVEWCCLLLKGLAGTPLYAQFGLDIIHANAAALERCFQPPSRPSVARSAIVITRRGLRAAFWYREFHEKAVQDAIQALTAKGSQPAARNAVMLGVIAGVCSRHEKAKPVAAARKADYFAFFTREILGSRTQVPAHIVNGLADFFSDFVSLEDLAKDVIPPVEKGLLRAPEVVLDIVPTIVNPLPDAMDLSSILSGNLMKPLLSNVKSSNPVIRQSVLTTFKVLAARSRDLQVLEKVADEILGPLKSGKLASPDHRVLHSEMLVQIPLSDAIAAKVTTSLPPATVKEGNETALAAELAAISKAAVYELQQGTELAKPVAEAFVKGLADKKINSRRIWILRAGDILANFSSLPIPANVAKFAEAVATPLADTWAEILKNPPAAVQSNLITGAFVFTALSYQTLSHIDSAGVKAVLKKAAVSKECLTLEPKPSFLLSHRVYGRLTSEDDLRWFLQAVAASAVDLPQAPASVQATWSQGLIYLSSSPTVSPQIRKEACAAISKMYAKAPGAIAEAIISGLWQWVEAVEAADKESVPASAKFDKSHLHMTLRSICLNKEEFAKLGHEQDVAALEKQMCSMLVISRQELVPRSSWIDSTLRVGLDPGSLARRYEEALLQEIVHRTSFEQKVGSSGRAYNLAKANHHVVCCRQEGRRQGSCRPRLRGTRFDDS